MNVHDFDGRVSIDNEDELRLRLELVRKGEFGAFLLHHDKGYPALALHINGDVAYLHYYPSRGHSGYQAQDMAPSGCEPKVRFLQLDGDEGNVFQVPDYTLVSTETAYETALEFFRRSEIPLSISWCGM